MAKTKESRKESGMTAGEFERKVLTDMTQDVIGRLEELVKANLEGEPWRCPWTVSRPRNLASGYEYKGMNRFYMSMMGVDWIVTPSQLRDMNVQRYGEDPSKWMLKVRTTVDGEGGVRYPKRIPYVFYKPTTYTRKVEDEDGVHLETRRSFAFKAYFGWNAADIEGLELPKVEGRDNPDIPKAQALVDASPCPVKLGFGEACYVHSLDEVRLPSRDAFESSEAFYGAAFHEMVHSTGAKGRLDRDLDGGFGSKAYADEELTAELGSVMLCEECGIAARTKDNSVAYLRSWMKALKDDVRLLYRAASRAEKAKDWLLGNIEEKEVVA